MGEGVGNPPPPGAPLRGRPPESRCPSAAYHSLGFCPEPPPQPRCLSAREGVWDRERGERKG